MREFAKVMLPVIAALTLLVIGTPSSLWAVPVVGPEIDPSSGMAAMALLAGAVMVIRGSRKK